MRVVLVCGDRNWTSLIKVSRAVNEEHKLQPITYLVEGGAGGADSLGNFAAKQLGIQTVTCDANWEYFGKAAGPIRNQKQLDLAAALVNGGNLLSSLLVLAFHPDLKNSKGTKDVVNRAKKAGVKVKVIK